MNHMQMILFCVYAFSLLISGIGIYSFVGEKDKLTANKSLFLGESILLGGILLVGELLILSLVGLYHTQYLWGMVLCNYLFLLNKNVLARLKELLTGEISEKIPFFIFCVICLILIFRNCYFLVDVDSHSTYLFAQKLWLQKGTSVFADRGIDVKVYVPHFDSIPYSLGISLFGQETLFCEFVNLLWRIIVLLLVYGYTSFRFNGYLGLAATMMVVFNDHFFYSGANQCVILNAALIAFLFAASYSFLEGRRENSPFRLFLALVFLSQLMANKYQMAYVFVFMLIFGLAMQNRLLEKLKKIFYQRKWFVTLLIATFFMLLWYLKNYLATGVPTFPFLAGKFHTLGWTPEFGHVFRQYFRGVTIFEFLKYMNYFFVWPGILPAKYMIIILTFFPFICLISSLRQSASREQFFELSYWLGLPILVIMGICLASHHDPRNYRFAIGVMSFSVVFTLHFIFFNCLSIKKERFIIVIMLLLSLPGYDIVYQSGEPYNRPTIQNNIDVILDKIHMKDVIKIHYPKNIMAQEGFDKNKIRAMQSAWDISGMGTDTLSAFLLPQRPQLMLWFTTVIKWDSYSREDLIIRDLEEYDLRWVMNTDGTELAFFNPEKYAKKAVKFERHPKIIAYPYDFPPELQSTHLK